jgi:hypothetical protein
MHGLGEVQLEHHEQLRQADDRSDDPRCGIGGPESGNQGPKASNNGRSSIVTMLPGRTFESLARQRAGRFVPNRRAESAPRTRLFD